MATNRSFELFPLWLSHLLTSRDFHFLCQTHNTQRVSIFETEMMKPEMMQTNFALIDWQNWFLLFPLILTI